MRRARIVAGGLALLFGAALLFLGVQRYRLPYDENGRSFDPQQAVVYEVQSAEVFTLAGAALCLVGLLLLLRRAGRQATSRRSGRSGFGRPPRPR